MGKYTKKVADNADGFEDDSFKYIVAEALDEIVTRLDRIENETKPRARSQAESEAIYNQALEDHIAENLATGENMETPLNNLTQLESGGP